MTRYTVYTYYCRQYQDSATPEHHECMIPIHVHPELPTNYYLNPNAIQPLIRYTLNQEANAWAPPTVIYMMQYLDAWDLMNS